MQAIAHNYSFARKPVDESGSMTSSNVDVGSCGQFRHRNLGAVCYLEIFFAYGEFAAVL